MLRVGFGTRSSFRSRPAACALIACSAVVSTLTACSPARVMGALILPSIRSTDDVVGQVSVVQRLPAPWSHAYVTGTSLSGQPQTQPTAARDRYVVEESENDTWAWKILNEGAAPESSADTDHHVGGQSVCAAQDAVSSYQCGLELITRTFHDSFPQAHLPRVRIEVTLLREGVGDRRLWINWDPSRIFLRFLTATGSDGDPYNPKVIARTMRLIAHEYFHVLVAEGVVRLHGSKDDEESLAYLIGACTESRMDTQHHLGRSPAMSFSKGSLFEDVLGPSARGFEKFENSFDSNGDPHVMGRDVRFEENLIKACDDLPSYLRSIDLPISSP